MRFHCQSFCYNHYFSIRNRLTAAKQIASKPSHVDIPLDDAIKLVSKHSRPKRQYSSFTADIITIRRRRRRRLSITDNFVSSKCRGLVSMLAVVLMAPLHSYFPAITPSLPSNVIMFASATAVATPTPSAELTRFVVGAEDGRGGSLVNGVGGEGEEHHLSREKRSVVKARPPPNHEHVCPMSIRYDYQPRFGHDHNGSRVEIEQNPLGRQFRATFIECEADSRSQHRHRRSQCFGIDSVLFTSECATLYEYRPAGIRLEGTNAPFQDGFIKVPITCQCRLRRKLFRDHTALMSALEELIGKGEEKDKSD